MNTYKDLLDSYIKNSGLTLEEISNKCKEKYDLKIHPTYIGKLRNGSRPPASYEATAILAKVLNGDPLLLLSYGREEISGQQQKEIELALERIYPEASKKEIHEKEFTLTKMWGDKALREAGINVDNIDYEHPIIITVPILGKIPAGTPVPTIENVIEFTSIPNPGNYKEEDLFILIVAGDSMTGSRIYEGDKVLVKLQPDVENGEIAVVNVNGYDATLKKVKKLENGQTWLFSTNEKYEPILINDENARIIGKVIQVMFEPKWF